MVNVNNLAEVLDLDISEFYMGVEEIGLYPMYQKLVEELSIYPRGVAYPALGLGGEFAEWLEAPKSSEMGDMLWYCAALCNEYGLKAQDVFGEVPAHQCSLWDVQMAIGQIQERSKKVLRDSAGEIPQTSRDTVKTCLCRVVAHLKKYCRDHDHSSAFENSIHDNVEKLLDRRARGKLQGEGDRR